MKKSGENTKNNKKMKKKETKKNTRIADEIKPFFFRAAVDSELQLLVKSMRKALEELDMPFKRERAEKRYDKFSIIINLPRMAYVYRFRILSPPLIIDVYEEKPDSSASFVYIECPEVNPENREDFKQILEKLLRYYKKPLWKFPVSTYIFNSIIPTYRASKESKTMFAKTGINVDSW